MPTYYLPIYIDKTPEELAERCQQHDCPVDKCPFGRLAICKDIEAADWEEFTADV